MTSVLFVQFPGPEAPAIASDLAAAGFDVRGQADCAGLVRDVLRLNPDLVVVWDARPDGQLIEAVRALQAQQPVPVLVFTQDAGVEWMERALEAGIHSWVVQGYAPQRLRPLVHLTLQRAAYDRRQREAMADLSGRFEERKLVDRAKGILMRARQVSEDEAFTLLRTASMHGNQRVGQVSRHVIEAAQVAEAINRAGQQRMLSQRLVKLYALVCSQTDAAAAALLLHQSCGRIDQNLKLLEKSLSTPTFGDLLEAARAGWAPLKRLLEEPPRPAQLGRLDDLAEALLAQADALVVALQTSGLAPTVHVINLSGRQRMLSQRAAKLALLAAADGPAPLQAEEARATAAAFGQGMAALAAAPLSSAEIRETLAAAQTAWDALQQAVPRAREPSGRMQIAAASEELLALFDRLTDAYQHSIQVLMG